jgi:hypothetical protein
MTRDSIELSLCLYWEILVGQCNCRPPRQARSGLDRQARSRKTIQSERSSNLASNLDRQIIAPDHACSLLEDSLNETFRPP